MLIKKERSYFKIFFYFLSAILVFSVTCELLWPNIILAYINLNYIFVIYFLSWLVLVI